MRSHLWDAATQNEVGTTMTAGPAAIRALAFGPGGKVLAAGGEDGEMRLWDTATQSQPGATMATGAPVTALSFSSNGTTLATAEGNGSTELWSAATREQTGAALAAQGSARVSALDFEPGAGLLGTVGGDGTARSWDVAFAAGLLDGTCAIAGQSLTRQQWAGYAGTQPFQRVCPES